MNTSLFDFINPGRGTDIITTGSGSDKIVIQSNQVSYTIDTADRITDFEAGADNFALDGIKFSDITINQGTDTYASHTILSMLDASSVVTYLGVLENVNASDLNENDFIEDMFSKKTFTASVDKWQPGDQTA